AGGPVFLFRCELEISEQGAIRCPRPMECVPERRIELDARLLRVDAGVVLDVVDVETDSRETELLRGDKGSVPSSDLEESVPAVDEEALPSFFASHVESVVGARPVHVGDDVSREGQFGLRENGQELLG